MPKLTKGLTALTALTISSMMPLRAAFRYDCLSLAHFLRWSNDSVNGINCAHLKAQSRPKKPWFFIDLASFGKDGPNSVFLMSGQHRPQEPPQFRPNAHRWELTKGLTALTAWTILSIMLLRAVFCYGCLSLAHF
jgi:hypothetical protein